MRALKQPKRPGIIKKTYNSAKARFLEKTPKRKLRPSLLKACREGIVHIFRYDGRMLEGRMSMMGSRPLIELIFSRQTASGGYVPIMKQVSLYSPEGYLERKMVYKGKSRKFKEYSYSSGKLLRRKLKK